MTDFDEEGEGPDGIVIIHTPTDGSDPYGVGPFPPIPDLVDYIMDNGKCDCRLDPIAVVFPPGMRMMIGVDLEAVMDRVNEIIQKGQTSDRLN